MTTSGSLVRSFTTIGSAGSRGGADPQVRAGPPGPALRCARAVREARAGGPGGAPRARGSAALWETCAVGIMAIFRWGRGHIAINNTAAAAIANPQANRQR